MFYSTGLRSLPEKSTIVPHIEARLLALLTNIIPVRKNTLAYFAVGLVLNKEVS